MRASMASMARCPPRGKRGHVMHHDHPRGKCTMRILAFGEPKIIGVVSMHSQENI